MASKMLPVFRPITVVLFAMMSLLAHASSARVELTGKIVRGYVADDHPSPKYQKLQIEQVTRCRFRSISGHAIELSHNCDYLRGFFRYVYQLSGEASAIPVLVGFSVSRKFSGSFIWLLEKPTEADAANDRNRR